MDISSRERKRLMRVIHDARDSHTGMLLEPSDLKGVQNIDEKLEKLEALGLLNLRYADDRIYSLDLTDIGLVFFETASDERWQFVRRSILVPIAASFATTALVWFAARLITGSWSVI